MGEGDISGFPLNLGYLVCQDCMFEGLHTYIHMYGKECLLVSRMRSLPELQYRGSDVPGFPWYSGILSISGLYAQWGGGGGGGGGKEMSQLGFPDISDT